MRTPVRMYLGKIRSVRDISRGDRARIATCSLRTPTDILKANYSIDFNSQLCRAPHERYSSAIVLPKRLSPSHTRLTTRLRPTCDRKKNLQSRANRRKNVRLVAEVVRLVAEVVGDRNGQISRNKFDGHVQNLKPAIPNGKRSHD